MRVTGLVFDFDGLILDTELPTYRAWAEVFVAHGCEPLTVEEWASRLGTRGGVDPFALLAARTGLRLDAAELDRVRLARRDELLAVERVRPGVERWLDEAAVRRLPVAVASSSSLDWVGGHLDRLGLRHRFVHLSCFGDGLPAKPAPDLYLAACAALGVEPTAALAVEDAPNGIRAAKAAGLRCVAVPNHLTGGLDLSAADLVVPSLGGVTLGEALDRLGSAGAA